MNCFEVKNVETSRSFAEPLELYLTFGQLGIRKLRHCFVHYWKEEGGEGGRREGGREGEGKEGEGGRKEREEGEGKEGEGGRKERGREGGR